MGVITRLPIGSRCGAWLGACLGLSVTACPIVETLVHGGADAGDGGETVVADSRQVEREIALYRNCHDSLVGPIGDSYRRYVDLAGGDEEPKTRRRLFIYGVTHNVFRVCEGGAAEARGSAVSLADLDQQLGQFVARAESYAEASQRFAEHLALPKPDRATTVALHGELLGLHAAWRQRATQFADAIAAQQLANDAPYLESLRGEGANLEYHARAAMVSARAMVRCASHPTQDDDCSALARAVLESVDVFSAYHDEHEGEGQHVFWLPTFVADLAEFRDVVATFAAMPRGEKPRPGHREALAQAYRVVSRDAATLDFAFPEADALE